VKLTIHLLLVPMLRMCGAIPPFHHMSSWDGTWLSTGTTLPFYTIEYGVVQQLRAQSGCAIAQAVRCQFLSTEVLIQFHSSPCVLVVDRVTLGQVFPCQSFHQCCIPTITTPEMFNRPVQLGCYHFLSLKLRLHF